MGNIAVYDKGQVRNTPLPNTQLGIRATGDSFGGAEAKTAGVVGAGLSYIQKALAFTARKRDTSAARDAVSESQKEMDKWQAEALGKKGIDAENIYEEATKAYADIKKEWTKNLKNEDQLSLYDASFVDSERTSLKALIQHQVRETIAHEKNSRAAHSKALTGKAVANRNNPKVVADSYQGVLLNTAETYKDQSSEIQQAMIALASHNFYMELYEAHKHDSKQKAQKFLGDNKDKFEPQVHAQLTDEIAEEATGEVVARQVSLWEAQGLSAQQMSKEADAVEDTEERTLLRKEIDYRTSINDKYERQAVEVAMNKAWGDAEDSFSKNQEVVFDDKVPFRTQLAIKDHFAQKAAGTFEPDYVLMEELNDMAIFNPEKFTKVSLSELYPRLGKDNYKTLLTLKRTVANRGTGSDFPKVADLRSVVSSFTKSLPGIQPGGIPFLKLGKAEANRRNAFVKSLFQRELDKYPKDKRQMVDTWYKVMDTLVMPYDTTGANKPYWEVKYNEIEGVQPLNRPKNVPKKAEWYDGVMNLSDPGNPAVEVQGYVLWDDTRSFATIYARDGQKYRANLIPNLQGE